MRITAESTLGAGSFGRVKLSKNKKTGQYVAIKILKKSEIIKLKQVDHILNEIKILSMVDHPFLVNINNKFRLKQKDFVKTTTIYI